MNRLRKANPQARRADGRQTARPQAKPRRKTPPPPPVPGKGRSRSNAQSRRRS